jgi:hypothetical protein
MSSLTAEDLQFLSLPQLHSLCCNCTPIPCHLRCKNDIIGHVMGHASNTVHESLCHAVEEKLEMGMSHTRKVGHGIGNSDGLGSLGAIPDIAGHCKGT